MDKKTLWKQWSTHFTISWANDKQINQLLGSSHRFVQQNGKNVLSKHGACMNTDIMYWKKKPWYCSESISNTTQKLWSVQFGLSECDTKLLKLLTFWVVGNDSESGMSHVTATSYCCKKSFCPSTRHSWCVKMETGNFSPKLVIKKKTFCNSFQYQTVLCLENQSQIPNTMYA